VRGLIHSDGCRTINRFRMTLPSGRVADVRWTLSNPRNVSVAHRPSIARLDEIGCAKD
jgi:hypothetical protein